MRLKLDTVRIRLIARALANETEDKDSLSHGAVVREHIKGVTRIIRMYQDKKEPAGGRANQR